MEKLNGFGAAQTAAKVLRKSPLLNRSSDNGAAGDRSSRDKTGEGRLRGPPPLLVVRQAAGATLELGGTADRQDDILMAVFAAAVHNERRRLARALHDELAQSLFVARLRLSTIMLTNRDDAIADALRVIGECLSSSTRATREMMADLSVPLSVQGGGAAVITSMAAPAVPSNGLKAARQTLRAWIIAVSRRVQREYGLKVTVEGACAHEPETEVRLEICAAVRELLMNVVKHVGMQEAWIHLSGDDCCIRIQVEDHGAGFDPAALAFCATTEGGFGLRSVRERLAATGGNLQLTSAVGQGTTATLLIPVPPRRDPSTHSNSLRIDQTEMADVALSESEFGVISPVRRGESQG